MKMEQPHCTAQKMAEQAGTDLTVMAPCLKVLMLKIFTLEMKIMSG